LAADEVEVYTLNKSCRGDKGPRLPGAKEKEARGREARSKEIERNIMKMRKLFSLIVSVAMLSGCATRGPVTSSTETPREQVEALQDVVEAVSGEEITEQDLRNLVHQARNDEETRSAVEAVSGAMAGEVIVKYCPIDGKRYSAKMLDCPDHKVPLEIVEE